MPDRYGPRGVFAIMIPLQNANMQPEYEMMRPAGVNNQIYRFTLAQHDKAPEAMIDAIGGALGCWPDVVVAGNSVEMRLWTPPQHAAYRARLQEKIGDVRLVTATDATVAALRTMGARRIAVLSPMHDAYSKSARDYYAAVGFDVPYHAGLQVQKPEDIIRVGPQQALEAFRRLDHDDVDTFLHVGGALGIVDYIETLEAELGRPVVSSNAATYWYALRKHGIDDPLPGFGQLLMKREVAE
jgi:maleate cis-trans isomerase